MKLKSELQQTRTKKLERNNMKRTLAAFVAGASAVALSTAAVAESHAPKLPRSMVWTAYDLGSSGYAEAAGIANAFQKQFNARVRIIPSGTSIGRLLPLTTGKASYGYLANEAFFAAEGTYDFAVPEWGPQDLRIITGRIATVGFAVAGDAGVKEVSDLKGKRIGYVKGNPSVNVKNDAYLAFGGLTRDDIQVVWFGSYGAMKTAVIAGQLDAFGRVTTCGATCGKPKPALEAVAGRASMPTTRKAGKLRRTWFRSPPRPWKPKALAFRKKSRPR